MFRRNIFVKKAYNAIAIPKQGYLLRQTDLKIAHKNWILEIRYHANSVVIKHFFKIKQHQNALRLVVSGKLLKKLISTHDQSMITL